MAFRSLGRAGSEIGRRVAGRSSRSNTTITLKHAGAECSASSWTGHFGRSRAPSYRPGASGASTQLFKLVETDLMSKELTRYDSSDAQLLGLHSIQDVLSELSAVPTTPSPSTPIVTAAAPSASTTETQTTSNLKESSGPTANMRQEKVLSAWGQVSCLASARVEEVGEVVAPSAGVGVLEAEEGVTKMAIKRTYQPSTLKRKRMHGFLYRSKSRLGKKILRRRLEKGRWRLGI